MSWALALGAAFAPGLVGFCLLSLVAPALGGESRSLRWGLAYGVGLVLLGWLSLVTSLLGYQLGGVDMTFVLALLILGVAWQRRLHRGRPSASTVSSGAPHPSRAARVLVVLLTGWVCFRVALTSLTCLLEPLVEWDALAIWAFRAKVLSQETLLHTQHLRSPHLAYSNLDYPLLWPFVISFVWKVAGSHDPGVVKSLGVAVLLAFTALFYGVVARRRDRIAALLALAVFTSLPMLQTGLVRLTADPILAFFVLGTVAAVYLTKRHEQPEFLRVAGILALGMILTKNEGLALWLIVLFSAMYAPLVRWLRNREGGREVASRALWLGGLPAGAALPWLLFRTTLPKLNVNYLAHFGSVTWSGTIERLPTIANGWLTYLAASTDWLWVWILVGAGAGLTVRERRRPGLAFLLAVGVLPFAVYTAVYVATPLELEAHMEVSASRLALHSLPVLMLCAFEAMHYQVRWPWLADPDPAASDAQHPEIAVGVRTQ